MKNTPNLELCFLLRKQHKMNTQQTGSQWNVSISEEGGQASAWLAFHTHEELPATRCQHPFPTPINVCISGSASTAGSANHVWGRRRQLIERTQICIFHAALSSGMNCNNCSSHVHNWNMQIEPLRTSKNVAPRILWKWPKD